MELGEKPQGCAAREVLEETGYRVGVGPLTGVYKNVKLGVVSPEFRCRVTGGAAHRTAEAAEVRWWTPEEVRKNAPKARAVRISDALKGGRGVPVRIHDGEHLMV